MSKIVHSEFIRETTMFTFKLLSFDEFLQHHESIELSFILKAGQILERSQQIQIL